MRRRRARRGASGAGALLILTGALACQRPTPPATWETVAAEIAAAFPDVPHLSTGELAARIADPARDVVLLDVRTPEEYAVSHLPGAARVTSADLAARLIAAAPDGVTIVAYDSVGYRSAALVAALQARGARPVLNLEGSIFRWANEGRPLHRDHLPIDVVHPHDDAWAVLLDPARRAAGRTSDSGH